MELREAKQGVRTFLREHYTDERLAMLLAHAQDGKLSYVSCCCFVGIVTANHALRDITQDMGDHYDEAKKLPGAEKAELAYLELWNSKAYPEANRRSCAVSDEIRRRTLIPIVKAEIRRRERLAAAKTQQELVHAVA
jgi:hypothetical protein